MIDASLTPARTKLEARALSALAGAVALAILMIPTLARATEELVRLVPGSLREASLALGVPSWRTSLLVVLRTALPGIVTAALLAVARAAGETAPLLFTALFSSYWLVEGGRPHLMQPTASLGVLILNFSGMPFENQIELAWAASLVLVLLVLVINVISRLIGQRRV